MKTELDRLEEMVNGTSSLSSIAFSIVEKVLTDASGKVSTIKLDRGCPSAARERIQVASHAAQMNEKMLKAKQEALKSALDAAEKSGDTETAKALQDKMNKVVETRRTNSENIDRLESIASDYAMKYKPKDDLGDQRAHAVFLDNHRKKLEERIKREEEAGFPSSGEHEKLKSRLEKITTAQAESEKWFEKNDPAWSRVSKATAGDEKAVAAGEKEKLKAIMAPKEQPSGAPAGETQKPAAAAEPKQKSEAQKLAMNAQPGTIWRSSAGKFGAKSPSGEMGDGRRAVKYFGSEADAQSYAKGKPRKSAPDESPKQTTRTWDDLNPKERKAAVKLFGSEREAKRASTLGTRYGKPLKAKTKKESLAYEVLDRYLAETYKNSGLGKWFRQSADGTPGWDRYNGKGERIGKCGDADEGEAYAACLSPEKAEKLGKEGIASFVRRKRSAQRKAGMGKKGQGDEGGGAEPVRVSTGVDKVEEEWSDEYKDSIDCDNPKGFSQRAHCQGRKKEMQESVSVEEMKSAVEELIALIKKHEKMAFEAKKAGNTAEYKKHRNIVAERSADIKTVQDMIRRAMRDRPQPITEKEEGKDETEGRALNKPFRTPGEEKKFAVYVKNDKGNVVKVRFGDPNMEIKRDDPDRLKAFRSRHSCDDNVGPKWKARYWSCQMWRSDKGVSEIISDEYSPITEAEKNEPTNPELWEKIQDLVAGRSASMEHGGETIKGPNDGKGFDVHPSAYSNAWASKLYKRLGGDWRGVKEETEALSAHIVGKHLAKKA